MKKNVKETVKEFKIDISEYNLAEVKLDMSDLFKRKDLVWYKQTHKKGDFILKSMDGLEEETFKIGKRPFIQILL